jgi:hypothetical protein
MAHLIGALLLVNRGGRAVCKTEHDRRPDCGEGAGNSGTNYSTANEAEAKDEERTIAAHPSTRA